MGFYVYVKILRCVFVVLSCLRVYIALVQFADIVYSGSIACSDEGKYELQIIEKVIFLYVSGTR